MNTALWVVQGLMAAMFLMAGMMKVTKSKDELSSDPKMAWANDVPAGQIKLAGQAEILGAMGLVLPWATGIAKILTPLAGVGLAITMLLAINVHRKRGETPNMMMNFMLLAASAFVAWGRFADLG